MIAVTPIKLNSQRLPRKNIKSLSGAPLLRWAIDTWALFAPVYVYGDRATKSHLPSGCYWIEEGDCPAGQDGNDLFAKMVRRLPHTDWVAIFNVTAPFIEPATIRAAIDAVKSGQFDSAVSAIAIQGRLWGPNYINHDPATCPRTQTQDPIYLESEAFWIIKPRLILDENRRVGHKPYFATVHGAETVDIDTPADWEWAKRVGVTDSRAEILGGLL